MTPMMNPLSRLGLVLALTFSVVACTVAPTKAPEPVTPPPEVIEILVLNPLASGLRVVPASVIGL